MKTYLGPGGTDKIGAHGENLISFIAQEGTERKKT